jgi:hypothetical protein
MRQDWGKEGSNSVGGSDKDWLLLGNVVMIGLCWKMPRFCFWMKRPARWTLWMSRRSWIIFCPWNRRRPLLWLPINCIWISIATKSPFWKKGGLVKLTLMRICWKIIRIILSCGICSYKMVINKMSDILFIFFYLYLYFFYIFYDKRLVYMHIYFKNFN